MITRQTEVYALLLSAAGSTPVHYSYPASWEVFPVIAYCESGSRRYRQADASEHLAELIYTIDIWGNTPEANAVLAAAIDAKLNENGYARASSVDLFENETKLHHRSMRYRVIADADGNNYQG